MSAPPGPSPVRVTLVEEEVIRDGGPRTVRYSVRHNAGWVHATSHPSAAVKSLDRGPGVVFRRHVTLLLAPGTEVERVALGPARRTASTLEHLTGGARGPRQRRDATRLRVGSNGALEPEGTK